MVKISCAMIVRDAEKTLPVALASVREHVDELVIVDTGSRDGTRDVASRYADVLCEKLWKDHFAEMREEAYSLCSGDWILHLDADDELIGGRHMRELVDRAPGDLGAYLLKYVTEVGEDGSDRFSFWRERLTRRGCYRWAGRIHEVLEPTRPMAYQRFADTYVIHRGHGDGHASLARNIRLLRMQIAERPDDPRALFYLGRDLLMVGDLDEALALLSRYVPLSTWADEAYVAQLLIGHIQRVKGRYIEAFSSDLALLNIHATWPQGYHALAEDCYYLGRWADCLHFSRIGESLPIPETNLFMAPHALESGWMIYRVVALHQLGDTAGAADLTDRALRLLPDDPMHLANRAYFRQVLNGGAPAVPIVAG